MSNERFSDPYEDAYAPLTRAQLKAIGAEVPLDFEDEPSEETIDGDRPVPCKFLTGRAGTGKTYLTKLLAAQDPTYAMLTATTGIAAINLGGATTINAALKYGTSDTLYDAYMRGQLKRVMHDIALHKRRLVIEEASMADARSLDIWYRCAQEVNQYRDVIEPFGLTLVGDFGQLPPVKAPWAFDAACWHMFADNTEHLTKVWRQDGGLFLDALNAARVGNGGLAAELLTQVGVQWHTSVEREYNGTTVLPKNEQVNRYNAMALDRLRAPSFWVTSRRWGKQRGEWGQNSRTGEWGIPPRLELKEGAYVMILANERDLEYGNGDCGHVEGYAGGSLHVRLKRTGEVVEVPHVVRHVDQYDRPEKWTGERIPPKEDYGAYIDHEHFRGGHRKYVLGQIEFMPVKLAYASTVHKSQGLTLDVVQIDFRDRFFAADAMLYVALSRCRTAEGLRLVGMREVFAKHCNANRRVREWL